MSKPNPENLISAYLDGELSSDEAAAVEQQLDASSALREELNDFTELRRSIQALPMEPAPADFHELVVANLPETAGLLTEPIRPWWMHPMVPTVVAVCLLVGIGTVLSQFPPGDQVAGNNELASPLEADTGFHPASGSEETFNQDRARSAPEMALDSAVVGDERPTRNQPGALMLEPSAEPDSFPSVAANEPAMQAMQTQIAGIPSQRAQVKTLTGKQLKQKLRALERTPEPGDVFSVLDETEGTPVVVEFTVVDVMDALYPGGKLNVLLRQKKGKLLTADPSQNKTPSKNDSGMVAVLLELDNADEMSLVLNDIRALEAFVYMDDNQKIASADKPVPAEGYGQPPRLKIPQNFIFTASILKEELSPLRQIQSEFTQEIFPNGTPKEKPTTPESPQTHKKTFGPQPQEVESSPMPLRALLLIREGTPMP